jgi:hypothetical protein
MKNKGFLPNSATYYRLIRTAENEKNFEQVNKLFEEMRKVVKIMHKKNTQEEKKKVYEKGKYKKEC